MKLPRASNHACNETICITCRDQAIAVRVVQVRDNGIATVDTGDSIEEVCVDLVEAGAGDIVLVHAGVAIGVLRQNAVSEGG